MDGPIPTSIGGYRIIAKLGQGGMATVYLGMALGKAKFRKLVVVKVLHEHLASKAEFLEMFLTEARLAARLSHANVVNTFEVGEDNGLHFMAMEYLEGQSYAALLRKVGRDRLPLEHHLRILIDVLAALHYAHEFVDYDGRPLDVVHRDVSPHNIFVTYAGQVKLVDFGIAKAACSDHTTRAGIIKGKIAYLAPEQAAGRPVDRRADVFAVGVLLWEALAGRRFASFTLDIATIHNRVIGDEPRIREVEPTAPADLAEICDHAIATDPELRYSSAEEFRAVLDEALTLRVARPNSSLLGNVMSEAFADERHSIRTVVEQHARAADSDIPPLLVEPPAPARAPSSPEGLGPATVSVSESPTLMQDARMGGAGASARGGGNKTLWFAVGAVVVAAAVLGGLLLSRRKADAPVDVAGTSPSSFASAPSSQGGSEQTIELVVLVSPPEAQVELDGVALPGNPIRTRVLRDGRLHVIRATAPGFAKAEQGVTFDTDATVKLTLTRVEGEPPPSARVAVGGPRKDSDASASAAPAATDVNVGDDLRKGVKPDPRNTKIDDRDPYAQ